MGTARMAGPLTKKPDAKSANAPSQLVGKSRRLEMRSPETPALDDSNALHAARHGVKEFLCVTCTMINGKLCLPVHGETLLHLSCCYHLGNDSCAAYVCTLVRKSLALCAECAVPKGLGFQDTDNNSERSAYINAPPCSAG